MSSSGVLDQLDAAVGALTALDWDALGEDEVVAVLTRVETVKRRLVPVDHAVLNQLTQRSTAYTHGCRSTAVLVSNLVRITRPEATARVRAAEALGPRRTVTGAPVEPRFPLVAAAMAEGVVSDRHADVVVRTVDRLPDALADEFGAFVEKTLVEQARGTDPRVLRIHADALAYALDQDGQLKDAAHRDKQRCFDLHLRPDGSSRLEAELTTETTELLTSVLDALTHPRNLTVTDASEVRTATQRRHDAFTALLKLVLRAEQVPNAGGVTTTVILTMDADTWLTGTGPARAGHGYTVPAEIATRWTGNGTDARFLLALLSKTKAVEAYSSLQRIFTEPQRLAMIARDGGCTHPDCDAGPGYCEAAHVTDWRDSHHTIVADGALACSHHHRHALENGWTLTMQDGIPHWTAPPWLDPTRTPRRNTRHDRPGT